MNRKAHQRATLKFALETGHPSSSKPFQYWIATEDGWQRRSTDSHKAVLAALRAAMAPRNPSAVRKLAPLIEEVHQRFVERARERRRNLKISVQIDQAALERARAELAAGVASLARKRQR
jgi:hypothetical protein